MTIDDLPSDPVANVFFWAFFIVFVGLSIVYAIQILHWWRTTVRPRPPRAGDPRSRPGGDSGSS